MKKIFFIVTLLLFSPFFCLASTLDQFWNTVTDDLEINNSLTNYGQSQTCGIEGYLTKVDLLMYRIGTPNTVTMELFAVDNDGKAIGSPLANTTADGNNFTTDSGAGWASFVFSAPYKTISGTKYAFFINCSDCDVSNEIVWKQQYPSGGYSGGTFLASYNVVTNYDMGFETFISSSIPQQAILNIPVASTSDMFASVGTLTSDLWVILTVAMGTPLAFFIIKKIIFLIPK